MKNEITSTSEEALELGSVLLLKGYLTSSNGLDFVNTSELLYSLNKEEFSVPQIEEKLNTEEIHDEYLIEESKMKEIIENLRREDVLKPYEDQITYGTEKEILGMSFFKFIHYLIENESFDDELAKDLVYNIDLFVSSVNFFNFLCSFFDSVDIEKPNKRKQNILLIIQSWIDTFPSESSVNQENWIFKEFFLWINKTQSKQQKILISNSGKIDVHDKDNNHSVFDLVMSLKQKRFSHSLPSVSTLSKIKIKSSSINSVLEIPHMEIASKKFYLFFIFYF